MHLFKRLPQYWPFVGEAPVDSPHKEISMLSSMSAYTTVKQTAQLPVSWDA